MRPHDDYSCGRPYPHPDEQRPHDYAPAGNNFPVPAGNVDHALPACVEPRVTELHVMRDRDVVANRLAAHHARRHEHMTTEKKLRLLIFQQLQPAGTLAYRLTMSDWQALLNDPFSDWNTDFDAPSNPTLPEHLGEHTHMTVGQLACDHPPSDAMQKAGNNVVGPWRRKGADVQFSLSLNYETVSILWIWCDKIHKGAGSYAWI
ncbi:hypothetical protein IL306_000083 [Fusarium sp. DS 682]|nr:hypothetical protein IL306_000083 [Fusarium sp. DS 682]